MQTSAFRWISWDERCSRSTSAWSRRRTAFHREARLKIRGSRSSTASAVVPSSLAEIGMSALWRCSASNSAVKVFPIPGGRWYSMSVEARHKRRQNTYCNRTLNPCPFPSTTSSKALVDARLTWASVRACAAFFFRKRRLARARALPDAGGRGFLMQACRLVVY